MELSSMAAAYHWCQIPLNGFLHKKLINYIATCLYICYTTLYLLEDITKKCCFLFILRGGMFMKKKRWKQLLAWVITCCMLIGMAPNIWAQTQGEIEGGSEDGDNYSDNAENGENIENTDGDNDNSEELIDSGTCGEYLTWKISKKANSIVLYNTEKEEEPDTYQECYTLTISGTGEMYNYSYSEDLDQENSEQQRPWEEFRGSITRIKVEKGVTSIGNYAFMRTEHLKSVELPEGLLSIGQCAFQGCYESKEEGDALQVIGGLPEITIPDSVTSIGNGAFRDNQNLQTVNYLGENLVTICPNTAENENELSERDRVGSAFGDTPWFEKWKEDTGGHVVEEHEGKAATCTEAGWKAYKTCKNCDYTTYEEIPAKGHDLELYGGKDATCTEAGLQTYVCKNCNHTTSQDIPAKGHVVDVRGGKAATCTEDGLTEEKYCSACGEILEAQRPILATGHNWDAGTVDGNTTTYKCTVCGVTKTTEEVVDDILDHTTTVVESLDKDNLTDDDKSTVIQTVGNVLDKMGTASEIQEKMEMDTIASIEELYISSENKVTSSTVKGDYASSSSDIKVEGAALTAKQYIEENSDDTTYNAEIRINEDTKAADIIKDIHKTDYVLDISLNIIKTTSDNNKVLHKKDIQPAAPIRMTIPVPQDYIGTKFKLYHYKDGEAKREDVSYTLSENKKSLTFVVSSLSPFAFVKVSEPEVVPPTIQKVEGIRITGLSHSIAAGKKIKLTATVLPKTAANKKVVWTSSNKKVATVSQSGVVTVLKKTGGKSVIITATAADGSCVKKTFKINSKKGIVTKVAITGKTTLSVGKSMKLKASVKATSGAYKAVKWTSSNAKYATVSSKGVVKALKAGKGKIVKITAMAMDGSGKKATIKIKLK